MTPHQRSNFRSLLTTRLESIFEEMFETHFPGLIGYLVDDIGQIPGLVEDLSDDELLDGASLTGEAFMAWSSAIFEKYVVECSYRGDTLDVLLDHIGDMLHDHPEVTPEQVRAGLEYYADRVSIGELARSFDDRPEDWLKRIALSEKYMGTGRAHAGDGDAGVGPKS